MSIQDRADQLGDRIAAISDDAEQAVAVRLEARLIELEKALLALWVTAFGSTADGPNDYWQAARFADAARDLLIAAMDPDLVNREGLEAAMRVAYELGVADATSTAPEVRDLLPSDEDIHVDLPDLGTAVDEQVGRASLQLTPDAVWDRMFDAVGAAMATARRSVSRLRATAAYEVTSATAEGVRDAAMVAGYHVIWVAERNACLTCLAYAGATALPGQAFPSELTFASRPMRAYGPILGPPRHPHCRCVLQLWDPSDEAVAEALRREAKRSVLRGWADDSESMKERLDAAGRLLARGAGMPKSVEEVARRAIRRGRFPENRPRQ